MIGAAATAMPASRPAILLVEDEAIVALDLRMQLEDLGYDVVGVADTAAGALDLAERHRPDLTLMDVVLQGEADGIDAAAAMKARGGLPVVFLTSFSDSDTVRRAAETGPYGYLTKPFQIRELRAGIEVALAKSRLERQLRDAERWYASTLRCVQDGIVVTDPQGRIRFVNRAAEALIGRSVDAVQGAHVDAVVAYADPPPPAPDRADVPQPTPLQSALPWALQHGRVAGVRQARRLRRPDGSTVPVDEWAGPVHGDNGEPLGGVLVLRDIADRLARDAALRSSEARFRTAFEHAPLGMALVGLDGRFLQVNAALCRLLDADAAWLRDRMQQSVAHPDDADPERRRLQALTLPGTEVVQFEKRYLRVGDGAEVWALVSASLLSDAGGPSCHLYQVHDLTAQKQAARQLADVATERMRREASEQASRSKSEFLARISHEMRTPLNAVIGFAQLLRMQTVEDAAPTAYADHILSAGQHLLALVDDVLQLQNDGQAPSALQTTTLPLVRVVDDALVLVRPLAVEHGIAVSHAIDPALCVRADERRLRQVLVNLVSNAVKYNRAGGSVVCSARVAGGRAELEVRDTGIGMTGEQLARLFEPFDRLGREASSVPGMGLGLVISRKLVEQMGGRLTIAAADDGTRATVELSVPDALGNA